ncbi:MAG: class I SAM-dependent methyltransferase [Bacteroidetes bacterium]|nr:class I SAM-dependent methyltransferase [Bacteroidota bacterium]
METKNKTWFKSHSHSWIVIIAASILAIIFINWLPDEKVFSSILVGLVLSHLLILSIATLTGWLLLPEKFLRKHRKSNASSKYDFGWSSRWTNGFGYAAAVVALLSVYSYLTLAGHPFLQPFLFIFFLLNALNLFIGNLIARASKKDEYNILPAVDLFKAGKTNVLDVGAGTGRTSIAISKASPGISIVAFDRFDAAYIDNGGLELLKHNLQLAGISDKVTIQQGDILSAPFEDSFFDAAVSTYMFDHLGKGKLAALKEMKRVLKPGGRFLLVILVKSYTSFAIGNVLSLAFDSRKDWKNLFQLSGYKLIDEGNINFGAFFLVEKPI